LIFFTTEAKITVSLPVLIPKMDKSISQPYVNVGSATNSGFSYISRKENDETSGTAFILNRAGGGEPILVI